MPDTKKKHVIVADHKNQYIRCSTQNLKWSNQTWSLKNFTLCD